MAMFTPSIIKERSETLGRVVGAGRVAMERFKTVGCVVVDGGVVKERLNPFGRVLEAGCVVIERIKTQGRVVARIASVRCWAYRSSRWRKRKPCEREWDEEETAHNPVSTKNENKYDNFKVKKINWPVAFAARFTACPATLDC